jgi:hypothetical protein
MHGLLGGRLTGQRFERGLVPGHALVERGSRAAHAREMVPHSLGYRLGHGLAHGCEGQVQPKSLASGEDESPEPRASCGDARAPPFRTVRLVRHGQTAVAYTRVNAGG